MRKFLAVSAVVFLVTMAPVGQAQEPLMPAAPGVPAAEVAAPVEATPAPVISYKVGQTTLAEVREYWLSSGSGVKVMQSGHLALGAGSGMDGHGAHAAERVLLVDVEGIDFEGISAARFGFFDEKLYMIQAQLSPGMFNRSTPQDYSEEQMQALQDSLLRKLGKPSSKRVTPTKRGKPEVTRVWKLRGDTWTFTWNGLTDHLTVINDKLQADIRKYAKAYCRSLSAEERASCWYYG